LIYFSVNVMERDKNVRIPSSMSDIPLRDYMKYMGIVEANPDADDMFLNIKALEIFCNIDPLAVVKERYADYDRILQHLADIMSEETDLTRRFTMAGSDGVEVEFGFCPNLQNMQLGEYIDVDSYINDIQAMHKAMAVLFRPIHPSFYGKTAYRIADYEGTEKYSEILLDMPASVAIGAQVFFSRLGRKLSIHMMDYSLKLLKTEELSVEQRMHLQNNMGGINNSISLLREMPYESKIRPPFLYTRRFCGYNSKKSELHLSESEIMKK